MSCTGFLVRSENSLQLGPQSSAIEPCADGTAEMFSQMFLPHCQLYGCYSKFRINMGMTGK